MHCGTGVLPMMENSPDDDFGRPWLMVVDDVLLYLEAPAAGAKIVPRSAGSRMLREHPECPVNLGSIARMLVSSPESPGVQRDVFKISPGGASNTNGDVTDRHRDQVPHRGGTVLQPSDRCPPGAPA